MYSAVNSERENWWTIFGEIMPVFQDKRCDVGREIVSEVAGLAQSSEVATSRLLWNRASWTAKRKTDSIKFAADAGFVYDTLPVTTDAVLREKITGVHCIERDLRFHPPTTAKNNTSIKLVEIYQRLGENSLSYPADGGGRFLRNAATFYTRLRGSTSNKHRSSNYT